jgi:GntR family transcriptional regulator / MocR family aminotransferase
VPIARARYNLRPDLPDFSLFPRTQWLAATAADADLAYGEPYGAVALRLQLAPFLTRTRGVVAEADRTGVFAGSTQALLAIASVPKEQGAKRIGVEDPGHRWRTRVLKASGLEVVPIPVDEHGLRVDALGNVDAVVVSPDHHFPTGVALSPERRRALIDWGRVVIEHDYDGHFRYDRPTGGTVQSLAPEHVAYVGTASPLLAPTLRIGWAVLPARLVDPVAHHMFANAVATPPAHAAHARAADRERALRPAPPPRPGRVQAPPRAHAEEAERERPSGRALRPRPVEDEAATLERARARGIAVDGVNEHAIEPQPPGLVVGFAALPEPALRRALNGLT